MIRRLPRLLVTALIVGIGISQLVFTLSDWHLRDAGAYWDAAWRLRNDDLLFPPLADPEASEVYRYSSWFAWAWVPLTYLPRGVADIAWSTVLLAASAAALVPLARQRAWLAVAFFAPILVGISAIGNVHPLIVAALVLGVERRSGPMWIGMAASLKAFPLLFAATYLGRRQWGRVAATLAITAALVAPTLLHDLSHYPAGAGSAGMLVAWPPVYVVAVAAGILVSVRLATREVGWLASATTVALALPRFFVYDVSYLMVGFARPSDRVGASSRQDAGRG